MTPLKTLDKLAKESKSKIKKIEAETASIEAETAQYRAETAKKEKELDKFLDDQKEMVNKFTKGEITFSEFMKFNLEISKNF